MMAVKPLFVDTNILIYANVIESPFHHQAMEALQAAHHAKRPLWISRQVLREYLVTMTRPQAFAAIDKATALEQVNKFRQQFHVADDTDTVTEKLLDLIQHSQLGGKQVHDANIVATMLAYDISCLLTHNVRDFARFEKLITIEGIGKGEN